MVFEVFRRRQKVMMATLAIAAMFAFILGSVFTGYGTPNTQTNAVVAEAWGEPIRFGDLQTISMERQRANNFLVRARLFAKSEVPFQPFGTSPDEVLAAIVLDRKAKQLDIQVSDQEVMEWLMAITDEKLSGEEFQNILLGRINPFEGVSDEELEPIGLTDGQLFEVIARELAIQQVLLACSPPRTTVLTTPLDAWQEMATRQSEVKLDFVEVPVDKFVDTQAEPTEEELRAVYNRYKNVAPDPESGSPGFLEPRRIAIQYFEANVDKHLEGIEVSDEEIAKYYEEHKSDFVETPVPTPPPVPPSDATETPKEEEEKPAPASEDEGKPEAEKSEPAEPKEPTSDDAKPAEESSDEPKAETKPEPAAEPAEEEEPESKPEGSAFHSIPTGRLAATLALSSLTSLQEGDAAEGAAKEEQAGGPEQPATEKEEPAEPAEKPAEEKEPAEQNAEPTPAPKEETPATEENAPATPPAVDPNATPPEPKYKPLEEVKNEIRKTIALEKASPIVRDEMQKIINGTLAPYVFEEYRPARAEYASEHRKEDGEVDWSEFNAPAMPDLEKIAKENGFELKSTGPLTRSQLDTLADMRSATRVDAMVEGRSPESFERLVFGSQPGADLYLPRLLYNSESDNYFLYWKTEDLPAEPAPFDSVHDQLVEIWRKESARPKAKEAAEKLAEKAKSDESKLESAIEEGSGYSVQSTDRVPRFQMIPGLQQAIPTRIAKIPGAGEEFLDNVFQLRKGEIQVLADQDGNNYYVVKVTEKTEPNFDRFARDYDMAQMFWKQGQPMMYSDMQMSQAQVRLVIDQIIEDAGFKRTAPDAAPPQAPVEEEGDANPTPVAADGKG